MANREIIDLTDDGVPLTQALIDPAAQNIP